VRMLCGNRLFSSIVVRQVMVTACSNKSGRPGRVCWQKPSPALRTKGGMCHGSSPIPGGMMGPIQRVNVDMASGMREELDRAPRS